MTLPCLYLSTPVPVREDYTLEHTHTPSGAAVRQAALSSRLSHTVKKVEGKSTRDVKGGRRIYKGGCEG